MKKLSFILSLLVLLGVSSWASAGEIVVAAPGPRVAVDVSFPGMRLVAGRPGYYCWYGGRYYSRAAWVRFCNLHPRFAYRYHRGYGRY
jgi:hypothetical protein